MFDSGKYQCSSAVVFFFFFFLIIFILFVRSQKRKDSFYPNRRMAHMEPRHTKDSFYPIRLLHIWNYGTWRTHSTLLEYCTYGTRTHICINKTHSVGDVVITTQAAFIIYHRNFPATICRLCHPGSQTNIRFFNSALLRIESRVLSGHTCEEVKCASRLRYGLRSLWDLQVPVIEISIFRFVTIPPYSTWCNDYR